MLIIKPNIKLNEIEGHYSMILNSDFDGHISLPVELDDEGNFGITIALIQLVSTLVRSNPDCKLEINEQFKNHLNKLSTIPYQLAASYLIKNHKFTSNKSVFNKNETLAEAKEVIESMQAYEYEKTLDGKGVFLSCFSGAKNEYLLPLYNQTNQNGLRGKLDFEKLIAGMISTFFPEFITSFSQKQIFSITSLLYELFENTNDHATKDYLGNNYDWETPNLRAIYTKGISFSNLSEESFNAYTNGDAPLRNFFINSTINKKPEESGLSFLELSIIDSGIGIAQTWHKKKHPEIPYENVDITKEEEYVRKAFKLRKTTKNQITAGYGLDWVIRNLNQLNAFVRLRTGKICLYQDFSSAKEEVSFNPDHWSKNNIELSPAVGTAFTVLIPMKEVSRSE